MTRLNLVAIAGLAGAFFGVQPAQAYEAPWCAVIAAPDMSLMSAIGTKRTFGSAISNSPPSREVLGSLSKRGATCSGETSSDFSVARP